MTSQLLKKKKSCSSQTCLNIIKSVNRACKVLPDVLSIMSKDFLRTRYIIILVSGKVHMLDISLGYGQRFPVQLRCCHHRMIGHIRLGTRSSSRENLQSQYPCQIAVSSCEAKIIASRHINFL